MRASLMDRIVGSAGIAIMGLAGAAMFKYHQMMEEWALPILAAVGVAYLLLTAGFLMLLAGAPITELYEEGEKR